MSTDYDRTTAVARLPNLDIEIHHAVSANGDEETMSITLRARPSFDGFGRHFELNNPFFAPMPMFAPYQMWAKIAQAAWAPWLKGGMAGLPWMDGRLLPGGETKSETP